MDTNGFFIPLEFGELLHVTLGTIADQLEEEGNAWAATAKRVLAEYTGLRNDFLTGLHGKSVLPEVAHHTFLAVEKVCDLADSAISEATDFLQWSSEVSGEIA